MRRASRFDRLPQVLGEIDPHPRRPRAAVQKVIAQGQPEVLDVVERVLGGQRVDGVLHRVGGEDALVVPLRVGRREIPFEADAHRDVLELVALRAAADGHQADRLFSIIVFSQRDGHAQLPR